MFPFVGAVPEHDGQWIAAGFAGHGKFFDDQRAFPYSFLL
jgi:hypothetical protein